MEKYVSNEIICCILCDFNAKMVERLDVFCYIFILLKSVEDRII